MATGYIIPDADIAPYRQMKINAWSGVDTVKIVGENWVLYDDDLALLPPGHQILVEGSLQDVGIALGAYVNREILAEDIPEPELP